MTVDREAAGKEIFDAGLVVDEGDGQYSIKYTDWRPTATTCNCPDKQLRKSPMCKHMYAVSFYIKANQKKDIDLNDIHIVDDLVKFIDEHGSVVKQQLVFDKFSEQVINYAIIEGRIISTGEGKEFVALK